MLVFPNAKINIGLNILNKRNDGFHDITSVFYPIDLKDVLEFTEANEDSFESKGITIPGTTDSNLVLFALKALRKIKHFPYQQVHLQKNIPIGAGLGGGSSDAAFTITAMNSKYQLGLSTQEMENIVAQLGSDCPFFIENTPKMVSGRGEIMQFCSLSLKGKYLLLINPNIHISTKEAYAGISPKKPSTDLKTLVSKPITDWKTGVCNDFEKYLFLTYPVLQSIKEKLYNAGAVYASMTGSGSTLYGIFDNEVSIDFNADYFQHGCFLKH